MHGCGWLLDSQDENQLFLNCRISNSFYFYPSWVFTLFSHLFQPKYLHLHTFSYQATNLSCFLSIVSYRFLWRTIIGCSLKFCLEYFSPSPSIRPSTPHCILHFSSHLLIFFTLLLLASLESTYFFWIYPGLGSSLLFLFFKPNQLGSVYSLQFYEIIRCLLLVISFT